MTEQELQYLIEVALIEGSLHHLVLVHIIHVTHLEGRKSVLLQSNTYQSNNLQDNPQNLLLILLVILGSV